MTISPEKLRSFVRSMVDEYSEKSILQSISSLDSYERELHDDRDFVQLGKRVNLPMEFFYENSNIHLANLHGSFIDALTTSEEKFILSRIERETQERNIDTSRVDKFDYPSLINVITEHIDWPDHLYLPNNSEYRKILYKWENAVPHNDKRCYVLKPFSTEVHWMPSSWGYSNGFVFDSGTIDIIQKRYGDIQPPDYLDYIDYNLDSKDNDRLMIYLGEHPNQSDEFDFFYRIVVSEPVFTDSILSSALTIQLPDVGD